MTDRELLRKLLYEYDWRQEDLAEALDFNRSNVSKVIGEIQILSDRRRKIAEELLEKIQKGDSS